MKKSISGDDFSRLNVMRMLREAGVVQGRSFQYAIDIFYGRLSKAAKRIAKREGLVK